MTNPVPTLPCAAPLAAGPAASPAASPSAPRVVTPGAAPAATPKPLAAAALPGVADGRSRTRQALAGLAAIGLACGGVGQAGPLADPTRPPSSLPATAPPAGQARPATGAAPAGSVPRSPSPGPLAAEPPPAPPLQALLLQSLQAPARGPAVAMVNGQLVKTGDSVAGRVVVAIDSQGLLLRSPAGDERLWLLGSGGNNGSKQAAGSIQGTRSTQYTPAARATEGSPDGDMPPRGDRLATPSALSLAGRTSQ